MIISLLLPEIFQNVSYFLLELFQFDQKDHFHSLLGHLNRLLSKNMLISSYQTIIFIILAFLNRKSLHFPLNYDNIYLFILFILLFLYILFLYYIRF